MGYTPQQKRAFETELREILRGVTGKAVDCKFDGINLLPGNRQLSHDQIEARIYNLLRAIKSDSFGICSICENQISAERHIKYPLAIRCESCQPDSIAQKKHKFLDYESSTTDIYQVLEKIITEDGIQSQILEVLPKSASDFMKTNAEFINVFETVMSYAASYAVGFAFHSLQNSNILPPHLKRPIKENKFINHSILELCNIYRGEKLLNDKLPYVEVVNFCQEYVDKVPVELKLSIANDDFQLQNWQSENANQITEAGFKEFRNAGRATHNSSIIRIESINTKPNLELKIQRAQYFDQVKSNLILDFKHTSNLSLRDELKNEYGNKLPELSDKKLVNSLGVAVLILYQHNGEVKPLLVPRAKGVAIFNEGGWHCSASGAAEWPDPELDINESTYGLYILDDLYRELQEEVGLTIEDLIGEARLVGVCRELARGGKPQLFYLAETHLDQKTLYKRIERTRLVNKPRPEPNEIEQMPYHYEANPPKSLDDLANLQLKGGMTHEALTLLHYYIKCMDLSKIKNKK